MTKAEKVALKAAKVEAAPRITKKGVPYKKSGGKRRSKSELRQSPSGRVIELYQTCHTVLAKPNGFAGTTIAGHTPKSWGGDEYRATKRGGTIETHYDEILPFAQAALADAKAGNYSSDVVAFINKCHSYMGHGGGKGGGKKTTAGIQDLTL